MKIYHQSLQNIVRTLVSIINLSLSTDVFPESLKIAKVIPVFKADDQTLFRNYIPISIHPAFSKLFEKPCSTDWLNSWTCIISYTQITALTLIDLISNISSAIDRNGSTLIFLDLSKAFDIINHKILCYKLHHYGIRDTTLSWIKGYLENGTQFVHFGSH